MSEGSEPGLFKIKFEKWAEPRIVIKKEAPKVAAPKAAEVFDVKKLFTRPKIIDVPLNVVAGKGNLVVCLFLYCLSNIILICIE